MSDVKVTATIEARDLASQKLKQVAGLADDLSKKLKAAGADVQFDRAARNYDTLTNAAREHLSVISRIGRAYNVALQAATAYAAFKLPHMAADAIREYIPVERSRVANQVAAGFSDQDRERLAKQESTLADKYGMTPEATIHAQGEFAKRHMNAATVEAMTGLSAALAKALDTSTDKAARLVESMAFGTGHRIESPADVHNIAQRFADIATFKPRKAQCLTKTSKPLGNTPAPLRPPRISTPRPPPRFKWS